MKAGVRNVMLKVASPVASYFDARFQQLHDSLGEGLRAHLDRRLDSVEHRLGWVEDRINERAADLGTRMTQLETRVTIDTQTAAELTATSRRSAKADTQEADQVLREVVGTDVENLGAGAADLLNWAMGHTGPSAQAGVWFNPPVTLLHREGSVRHNEVNERIVEIPYAMGVAAALPPSARVLDVGAAESTLSLSLASLGLEVTASDLRPYPFEHPRLHTVVGPLEDWSGPDTPFDAVFCVSSIEHFGLGAYGDEAGGADLDRRVIERIAGWLAGDGELVLTAPYGKWAVDEHQRVYDAAHMDALLQGWKVLDRRVCVQTGPDRWERADGEPPASTWADATRGVVLLRATPEE